MAPCNKIDLNAKEADYVLNRIKLCRDHRDFHIQQSDSARREDYPGPSQSAVEA